MIIYRKNHQNNTNYPIYKGFRLFDRIEFSENFQKHAYIKYARTVNLNEKHELRIFEQSKMFHKCLKCLEINMLNLRDVCKRYCNLQNMKKISLKLYEYGSNPLFFSKKLIAKSKDLESISGFFISKSDVRLLTHFQKLRFFSFKPFNLDKCYKYFDKIIASMPIRIHINITGTEFDLSYLSNTNLSKIFKITTDTFTRIEKVIENIKELTQLIVSSVIESPPLFNETLSIKRLEVKTDTFEKLNFLEYFTSLSELKIIHKNLFSTSKFSLALKPQILINLKSLNLELHYFSVRETLKKEIHGLLDALPETLQNLVLKEYSLKFPRSKDEEFCQKICKFKNLERLDLYLPSYEFLLKPAEQLSIKTMRFEKFDNITFVDGSKFKQLTNIFLNIKSRFLFENIVRSFRDVQSIQEFQLYFSVTLFSNEFYELYKLVNIWPILKFFLMAVPQEFEEIQYDEIVKYSNLIHEVNPDIILYFSDTKLIRVGRNFLRYDEMKIDFF